MKLDYLAIGKQIRKFRKRNNWTQEKLSEQTNISKQHISHIENGGTKLSLQTLINIANALETSVDQLLGSNICVSTPIFKKEIENILIDCDNYELEVMIDTMNLIKNSLRNMRKHKPE